MMKPSARRTTTQSPPRQRTTLGDIIFHLPRAVRLIGALLRDRRVGIIRKVVFVAVFGAFALALIIPETLFGAVVGTLLPLIGLVLNLPPDVVLDWFVLGIASFEMLRVFPRRILAEHYQRIYWG
jgi:hypothetical protein